jgi:hypothetical protein
VSESQQQTEIKGLDYVVVGVAVCYQKNAEGKTDPVRVVEPIPSTALEAMSRGIRTSFEKIYAAAFAELVRDGRPAIPTDILGDNIYICHDFVGRTEAAARTYRAKPHLRLVPVGGVCTCEAGVFRLKYDPGFRRVLGGERQVSDSDNVKQHAHTHRVLI